jgi:hypothetical protein
MTDFFRTRQEICSVPKRHLFRRHITEYSDPDNGGCNLFRNVGNFTRQHGVISLNTSIFIHATVRNVNLVYLSYSVTEGKKS